MAKLPDSEVKSARESDIVAVIESYGIELEKAGPEYRALCPFHSERSPSFTVTPGKGRFHCFGCGAAGTPIDFVQEYASVDFRTAVNMLNGVASENNITPRERRVIEREQPIETWTPRPTVPVDALVPPDIKWMEAPKGFDVPATFKSFTKNGVTRVRHDVVQRWSYLNADGELIGYISRFDLAWGGKEVSPQTYCTSAETGECGWRWLSFGKPRPLYGLDLLAAHPKAQVLVVEGEKACDAARALFAAAGVPTAKLLVVSWPGGGKAIKHVDWTPLHGRSVALWPDADQKTYTDRHEKAGQLMPFGEQTGFIAMRDIFRALVEHCDNIKFIMPPAGVPDGWDLADDLPADFHLLAHMKGGAKLAADVFSDIPDAPDVDLPPGDPVSYAAPDVPPVAAAAPDQRAVPDRRRERPEAGRRAADHDRLEDPALGNNGFFRILGYDRDRYYILQFEKCQIMCYAKGDFSDSGLIELAPLDWWETNFSGGKSGGVNKKAAMNWIVRKAHSRGIYDMSRIRGRGAWTDVGRMVFHHGDYLTVDGQYMDITELESRFVYEMSIALPEIDDTALTAEDGRRLLDIAEGFRWSKPASAALICGWIALAPLCGAIKWRPHIWLTGGPGSGKSTVLEEFMHPLLNGMELYAQGNSTEAGLRQELKGDAIPVLFDESESNDEKESMRIQNVLSLIRQASTESHAKTYKGTAGGNSMSFHIRSMFCLASIQVGIKYQADIERMTVLSLLPKRDDNDANGTWNRIKDALHSIKRDESLPGRLVRRSMEMLPVTLQNIQIFSDAAAVKFGSQRDGDQYGTLMAGAWSMISDDVATPDAAMTMINAYDWSEHRESAESDEGDRALATLMGAPIRIHGSAEVTVNELIRVAEGREVDGVTMSMSSASAVLQRHGMRTEGNRLLLANTSNELRRLVEGTPFAADLRGVLLRVRGAQREPKTYKFSGVNARVISIPLDGLLTDDATPAPDEKVQF